jgi:hypothetical protein
MFRSLHLVHDEIGVASEATRSEGQPKIANVLSCGVCNSRSRCGNLLASADLL